MQRFIACQLVLLALLSPSASAGEPEPTVGQRVPNFYTRVVTGPLMNQSVCFVCRNGNRPTVMVLSRELNADLKLFLRNVDRIVDQRRTSGLKCFAVYLTNEESIQAISAAQTFAFNAKLESPLSVSPDNAVGPGCLEMAAEAEIAVVLYQKRAVVQKYSFKPGQFSKEEMRSVLQQITELGAGETAEDEPAEETES